jgi:peptide deformylase
MTKDDIIALPNAHLRQKSARVGVITPEILDVIRDMQNATINWDQSREHEVGVALAAVQIDRLYKIIIVRNNYDDKDDHTFTTFINPQITKFEGAIEEDFEGCLSVRDIYGKVPRHTKVRVKALDESGKEFRVTAEGFLARIFQHEIDHCNGIVFIDHIKDNPEAFYQLTDEGKLEPLDYDNDIKNSDVLWQ